MPFNRRIKVGSIDYTSGQKKTLDIPRDGVLVQLNLRVKYTVTNGGTAPVGPFFQALARILRRVDIVVAGRDTPISQSGEALASRAHYEFGTLPDGMGDTVVLTASAATVYDVSIPIALFLPRSRDPMATALDLRKIRQATLEITWAPSDCTQLYTTPNSAAISAVTCDVEAVYMMDVPEDRGFLVRQLSEIKHTIAATNSALALTIDGQTGLVVRSLCHMLLDDSVGSNAILDAGSIIVQSGAFVFQDEDGPALQAQNKIEFSLEALDTGVYYQPLTFAGDLAQAINTDPTLIPADLKAVYDATKQAGTNEILVSVEAIRQLKIA